jgi:anaerobic magnesium-protoporphyrin IX monomethyl ester cyclase
MKLLLINAINPLSEVQYRWPNLGLCYLAASIRQRFGPQEFEFRIIDRDVAGTLKSWRPEIVGITSVSQNYNYAKAYAHIAKQAGAFVVMGGMHISSLPGTMTQDMDVAVIGEGERVFCDILEAYLDHRPIERRMQAARLIEPIDQIPRPARDLVKIRIQSNLFSSRGCPYRCVFCFSSRYWKKVRFFSAEYVAEELREMYRMGVRRANFYDDLMIADTRRLARLHDIIVMDPELSEMKFWLNARANTVTEETAEIMASMGVVSVGMGLESGNERTLRYLKGGTVSVEDNYNAVRILHEHGIGATASFVIGSPDETEEEIMDTYRFIQRSGLDFVDIFPLVPFPETPVWEEARERGLVSDDMDWNRLNVYWTKKADPIVMSRRLTREDMDRIYAKFHRLRLWIAFKRAWFHPFFKEMVKAGVKKSINLVRMACQRSA